VVGPSGAGAALPHANGKLPPVINYHLLFFGSFESGTECMQVFSPTFGRQSFLIIHILPFKKERCECGKCQLKKLKIFE